MKELFQVLNQTFPMSEVEREQILPFLSIQKVEKQTFILKEGQVCDFFVFVKKGSFRSFYNNSKGDSINIMLNAEYDIIGNLESYATQEPSNVFIQAIEPSELIFIYKKDLDKLYETSLYWNQFGRILTENIFIVSKRRLESLLYNTPEKRYLNMIEDNQDMLRRYPLNDIASFIGVTPQSLSRIRSRVHLTFNLS